MKKGEKMSEKHKEILRQSRLGHKHSDETKIKMRIAKLGIKLSPEHIQHLKDNYKGFTGLKHSEKTRKILSEQRLGILSSNWKGGVETENKIIRKGIEFRLWREAVFARDNFTCKKCNIRGVKLRPHHILNFSSHKELRFAIDNGITLCEEHHREFHKIYGFRNNTKEQIEEYIINL